MRCRCRGRIRRRRRQAQGNNCRAKLIRLIKLVKPIGLIGLGPAIALGFKSDTALTFCRALSRTRDLGTTAEGVGPRPQS
jgi:hypothetical protein